MKSLFISTQPDDSHAAAATLVLSQRGYAVTRWFGGDFPDRQCISVAIGNTTLASFAFKGPDLDYEGDSFDVVWNRRPVAPRLPQAKLHPDDIAHAEAENREFFYSFLGALAPSAVWVNSLDGKQRASSKLLQLREARAAGLSIPETLCSNDGNAVRDFIDRHHPEQTIHKSFLPLQWSLAGGIATSGTAVVTKENLPSDHILQLTPGIYQHRITKKYEVRATFFGDYAVTVAIDSQKYSGGDVDWRNIPACDRPISEVTLPDEVHRKCVLLMRRLGILFGSFDFIVTPDGNHVFLEVNEAGQFLWQEDQCPTLPLLDICCEFLTNPRRDFSYTNERPRARLADVVQSTEFQSLRRRDMEIHGVVTARWRGASSENPERRRT